MGVWCLTPDLIKQKSRSFYFGRVLLIFPTLFAFAALQAPLTHTDPASASRAASPPGSCALGDPAASLRQYFGHDAFRAGQGAVVAAVLAKQDVAVFWTSGSGKSLCYQLPSLHLDNGTFTLVVSPLLALIQDQVGFFGVVFCFRS